MRIAARHATAVALGTAAIAAAVYHRSRPRHSFRDQVVVITGGSRGLGLALAMQFAREGAALALLARDDHELQAATDRLMASGALSVMTIVCDVRHPDEVARAVDRVREHLGTIDVVVNNAGVVQATPVEHAQVRDFEDSMATHFWGPFHVIHACVPRMMRERAGRVINIASIGGRIAVPHLLPYTVGKFALVGLSEGLHAELAKHGVSVTTATPFLMRTGSHRNALVRGQHRKEAVLFAMATASSLTSVNADRAARMIVEASRRRRARVTPGIQGRLAEVFQTLAPETTGVLLALASRWLLPAPTAGVEGNVGVLSRDIDTGNFARVFSTQAALRFNQDIAEDEKAKVH